jgi:molecular chaperone GrpE
VKWGIKKMSFKKGNKIDSEAEEILEEGLNEEKIEDQEFEGIIEDDEIDENSIASLEGLVEELQDQNKKIADDNAKLNNEIEALKERILRLTAEYDNFRKRTAKEKEGIYTDACEDVLKNILPVLDNLERAAAVNGSVEDVKKGVEMTVRQFTDSLTKLKVEEIPTDGEFDPNLHNAVMHVEDEQFGTNQIVEVFQKGYKKEEKVLRHSMVKVAN